MAQRQGHRNVHSAKNTRNNVVPSRYSEDNPEAVPRLAERTICGIQKLEYITATVHTPREGDIRTCMNTVSASANEATTIAGLIRKLKSDI